MAKKGFAYYSKQQEKLTKKTYKEDIDDIKRQAKEDTKSGHILTESERGDRDVSLLRVQRKANDIGLRYGWKSGEYKQASKMLKGALRAENKYRKAASAAAEAAARKRAATEQPKVGLDFGRNDYRQGLAQVTYNANKMRQENAAKKEEADRRAYLYKYGDVDHMSAKELGERIKKLESEKEERNKARAAAGDFNNSAGAAGGGVSAILNKTELTPAQRETMDKLDADADDKLEVYKKALPSATVRDEEKKLSKAEIEQIRKAADVIRRDVDDGQGHMVTTPQQLSEIHNKARQSVDYLKKRGVDTDYLIEAYGIEMDNKEAEETEKDFKEWAGQNALTGALASLGTIVASPFTGITDLTEDIYHSVRNTVSDKPTEVNQKRRGLGNYTQAAREGVSEKIENPIWNFIYNAGMSTGDSAMAIAAGGLLGGGSIGSKAAQTIMSAGAADQTYNEAIERGLDPMHALATGLMAGAAEYFTEKYSIDSLKSMATNKPKNLKELVKNIGKQMVTEGSEEAASDVMNTISDNIINGKKSEYNQSIKRYMDQGLTKEQAKRAAMMDWIGQTAYDAAAGAFSGGLMGSGAQAMSYSNTQNEYKNLGAAVKKTGDIKSVIEYAKKFGNTNKLASKENLEDKDLGVLTEEVEQSIEKKIKEANSAEELKEVREELIKDAPDVVSVTIDNNIRERALELSEDAKDEEKESLNDIAETSTDNWINTSARLDERINGNENTETEYNRLNSEEEIPETVLPEAEDKEQAPHEEIKERKVEPRVLNHKQATLDASGEPVTIEGFTDIGTKNVKLKIDGMTDEVSFEDVSFPSKQVEQIYKVASHMDNNAAAAALVSNYDGKQDTVRYCEDFEKAYNWGTTGMSYSQLRRSNVFSIPEHIVKTAWMLGDNYNDEIRKSEEAESAKIREGKRSFKKGQGTFTDERTDENAEYDVYTQIDKMLAKKLGVDIKNTDKIEKDGKAINGLFDASKAEMHFSDAAKSKLGVRLHESMEFLETMDPEKYRQVVSVILLHQLNANGGDSVYKSILEYRKRYRDIEGTKTFQEAADEYFNDAIAGAFMTEEGAKDFIEWLGKENIPVEEKKSIFKTILDIIKGFIESIQSAIRSGATTKAEERTLKTTLEQQETIRTLYKDAMDSAIRNYNNSEDGETEGLKAASVSYSAAVENKKNNKFSDKLDNYSEREIDNWKNSKSIVICENEEELKLLCDEAIKEKSSEKKIYFGKITQGLAKEYKDNAGIDVDGYNLCIHQNEVRKTNKTHGSNEETQGQKNVDSFDYEKAVLTLSEPDTIQRSEDYKGKPCIKVTKDFRNKYTVVAYVVKEKHDLRFQTMYISLAGGLNANALSSTPGTNTGTATNYSIAQSAGNAIEKSQKNENAQKISNEVKLGEIEQKAADYFGTTEDFKVAGYMLPDGRLLDFSGAHYMDSEEEKENFRKTNHMRTVDHEDIYEVMESSGDNRKQFMERGNIRMSPEAPGINISTKKEPTSKQYQVLKEFIRETQKNPDYDGSSFYVDLEDDKPHKITYTGKINADRIVNDIKSFYSTGVMPEGSGLDAFRYSAGISDIEETPDLIKENKHLQKLVENLKHEFELTGGNLPDTKKIKTAARRILKQYNSKFDLDTLTENISNVYKYLRQDGADFDEAVKVMSQIAKGVLERSEVKDTTMSETYKDLKTQLKKDGVLFSDAQMDDIKAVMGITEFKQKIRGKLRIKKEGTTNLEQMWEEWADKYPELFEHDVNELEMPFKLLGILDALEDHVETLNGETIDQMAYDVAMQIYAEISKVPPKLTFADKKEKEKYDALEHLANSYEKLVSSYREEIKELNGKEFDETLSQVEKEKKDRMAKIREEIKEIEEQKKNAKDPKTLEQYKKALEKKGEQIKRLQTQNDKKIAEVRQNYINQHAKRTEQRQKTDTKNKIRRLHEKFRRMILKPKEGMYVPAPLMQSAIKVCETVNLGAKEGTNLANVLNQARRAFEQIKKEEEYIEDDFNDAIKGDIDRLARIYEGKPENWTIYDMTASELNEVYNVMQEIYDAIRLSTKLIREEGEKEVRIAGKNVIKELESAKGVKDNKLSRGADRVTSSFLNSYREFRRLSGYKDNSEMMFLWKELNEGQKEMYNIQMEGEKKIEDVTKTMEKYMTEIDSKKSLVKAPLRFESGNAPVMITRGMRLALILHAESKTNLEHMINGGVMIPADISLYAKDKKKAYEKTRKVVGITRSAIMQMRSELNENEKKLLHAFEDLFHNWSGEKINKTSMDLYGFKKARVHDYYPISVDKDFITTDIAALKYDKTIEGMGFLKERVTNVNPIILESVIDTAQKTINGVAMFSGLAIPIRNFNKVMNVTTYKPIEAEDISDSNAKWTPETSVKKTLKEVWGERAEKYINDMISDLQQGRRSETTVYDKLRGNYAGAVLTANASVIIKQTSAYPMCAAITGWRAALKAMVRGGKHNHPLSRADQDLIAKYTPIYWERNKGNSTRELAEIREYKAGVTKLKPVRMVTDAIQKVDMAMVGRFWYAAQYYINQSDPELYKKFKSDKKRYEDQYYTKVAEVFDRCVEETQSTNMVLQNADIMRNTNAATKIITMFMGQGLQNFGIVYDNLHNMRAKAKQVKTGDCTKAEYKQAKKDFCNAISSQIVSAAVFAGLAIVARGLLHRMNPYRDDKEEITAETIADKWFDDFLDNIIGSVPLGSFTYEWVSAAVNAASGNGWVRPYGTNDIVLQSLSDLESSTVGLFKAIGKGEGIGEAINDVTKDGSKLFGVPWENVWNLFDGAVKHVEDVTNGNGFLSFETGAKNPKAKSITEGLIEAIDNGDAATQEKYIEKLYDLGKDTKQINQSVSKQIKENEDIKKAADAVTSGDTEIYIDIVTKYEDKGYPRASIVKAINSIVNAKNKTKEEKPTPEQNKEKALLSGSYMNALKDEDIDLFKSKDILSALETGKKNSIDKVVKEIVKSKTNGSKDEEAIKKAVTSIKSSVTRVYKAEYMSAETAHERQEIIKKLQLLEVNGNKVYTQDDFKRWDKEYQKQK